MAHVHRLTPSPALIFTTIISLVVLIPGDFQSIVNYFRWRLTLFLLHFYFVWVFFFFSTHCFFCLSLISLPLPFSVLVPGFSMPLSCLGSSISKSRRRTSQGRTRLVSSLFSHYMTITSCPHAWLFLSPQVPIVIPILVLIAAIFLVLAPIIDNPQIEYLYVALFISSGIVVYIPFIHYKLCPRVLDKLTVFLQLFLEVAPADKNL